MISAKRAQDTSQTTALFELPANREARDHRVVSPRFGHALDELVSRRLGKPTQDISDTSAGDQDLARSAQRESIARLLEPCHRRPQLPAKQDAREATKEEVDRRHSALQPLTDKLTSTRLIGQVTNLGREDINGSGKGSQPRL
jgi:hypothetical protein